MSRALVECVPNFSEGRDPQKIEQILEAARQVEGVKVLDVDPGEETNRTVVTLLGAPEPIAEAAFQGAAPLAHNAFKLPIGKAVVRAALEEATR